MRKPVQFAKIRNDSFPMLPEKVVSELSHEQEYMYDMCRCVIDGKLTDDMECQEPGNLCYSCWGALGNCILLKYVTTKNPSKSLKRQKRYNPVLCPPMVLDQIPPTQCRWPLEPTQD